MVLGSGGLVTDLVFNGGNIGANIGNQQFTMRNLTFYNSVTAITQIWDWGWTYHGININSCSIGLNMSGINSGVLAVGSVTFIDSSITNTPIGILTARGSNPNPASGASLILENVRYTSLAIKRKANYP
jgi:glucan 1,3-beta-glucosidase